jgi:uncharacterized protein YkwD
MLEITKIRVQSAIVAVIAIALLSPLAYSQFALQSGHKPWPGLRTDPVSLRTLERRTFDMVNQERARQGLNRLVWNDGIAAFARRHSDDMSAKAYFSHVSLSGDRVADRADRYGITDWGSIGENIATMRGFSDPATHAITLWMNSSGHRRNMLRSNWDEGGLGVSVTGAGEFYFTQVFIRRR